jgi:hypothetical protein
MRRLLLLVLASALALPACTGRGNDEERLAREIIAGQDSVIQMQREMIRAQRAEVDSLREMARDLDLARDAASDAALAQPDAAEPPPPGRTWPATGALAYGTYRNAQYGYSVEYPTNLFLPEGDIGNGRGQSYTSADGSALLLLYATDDGPDALRLEYEAELARPDQEVSYRVLRSGWFVVSGHEGPYIFYQRTHRSPGGLRTFRLRHLARDKDYFGPVTERLSHSFRG